MSKKKIAILSVIGIVCLLVIIMLANKIRQSEEQTPREQAYEMMDRIEGALNEMDDDWKKQSVSEIVPFDLNYEDGKVITYYVCTTTYYEADPPEVEGLSEVLNGVIDPETAESSRECEVSGLDAMLYEKDGRAFLCWTVSAECSLAIEYGIGEFSEDDIFKMAESVPANTES